MHWRKRHFHKKGEQTARVQKEERKCEDSHSSLANLKQKNVSSPLLTLWARWHLSYFLEKEMEVGWEWLCYQALLIWRSILIQPALHEQGSTHAKKPNPPSPAAGICKNQIMLRVTVGCAGYCLKKTTITTCRKYAKEVMSWRVTASQCKQYRVRWTSDTTPFNEPSYYCFSK